VDAVPDARAVPPHGTRRDARDRARADLRAVRELRLAQPRVVTFSQPAPKGFAKSDRPVEMQRRLIEVQQWPNGN
jgi:hypothetical protein